MLKNCLSSLSQNPSPKRDCITNANRLHVMPFTQSNPPFPTSFPSQSVCLEQEKQYQMWRGFFFFPFFFFSVQSGIKTLLFRRGGGGRFALHRLGSLFIEMEQEGRKNKYTTAFKHLLCLPRRDERKHCLPQNWLNWDEAVGTHGGWWLCLSCLSMRTGNSRTFQRMFWGRNLP